MPFFGYYHQLLDVIFINALSQGKIIICTYSKLDEIKALFKESDDSDVFQMPKLHKRSIKSIAV